jgi:hypothetical protein
LSCSIEELCAIDRIITVFAIGISWSINQVMGMWYFTSWQYEQNYNLSQVHGDECIVLGPLVERRT